MVLSLQKMDLQATTSPYVCIIMSQTVQHMAILWDDPLQEN